MRISELVKNTVSRTLRGDNLRAKATRGGVWLGAGSASEQVTRFVRNMLLARLLAPSAFGAMAIVLSASSLVTSLSDVGIWPAVIQSPRGGDDTFLNAAWWMGLGRALCIYAMVFPAAPWIANFYGNADISALLRVTLLGIVLDSMLSPRAKRAQKELRLGRFALLSNGGAICGVILTVVLSLVLRSVWALAIGYCAENAFRCLFSYILCPGLPSFRWDKHAVIELLAFSKGMLGLSFLNLVFARTDIFVLGKLYSPATLGLYSMAVALVQTPANFLINVLSQTLLPAFSHVQSDFKRMNRILSEATSWTLLFGLPALVIIWLFGRSLLTLVYGSRYAAATGALVVAGAVASLNVLNSQITSLFFALGRPALHRRAVGASALVMVILIYPLGKHIGVIGGQVAALIAIAASYALQALRTKRISGLDLLQYGKAFGPGVMVSLGMLGAEFIARSMGTMHLSVNILVAVCACLFGYTLYGMLLVRNRQAR